MTTAPPLRPPSVATEGLPRLLPFKFKATEIQVFTHRSLHARPTAIFEDPLDDIAPDNEVLELLGDSVLSLAAVSLARDLYPGLRVGSHAKIRTLVVQNVTIATISEHYKLADKLRANQSQLVSLQHSTPLQADLFEAYIGGLYNDHGWDQIKPWLFHVLRPYVQEAYRIVKNDHNRYRETPEMRPGPGPGPGPKPRPAKPPGRSSPITDPRSNTLGIIHSPGFGGSAPPPPSSVSTPESVTVSPAPWTPSPVPEGHLSLLNQILQHTRKSMDWDFEMDPNAPATTPVWDAVGKLNNEVITTGRGNTKRLAKNDGAKRLVVELQENMSDPNQVAAIPALAKELERHRVRARAKREKAVEAAVERHSAFSLDDEEPLPAYKSTPSLNYPGKGKGVANMWRQQGGEWSGYGASFSAAPSYSPGRPGG